MNNEHDAARASIRNATTVLGIELGSTRIKAVLLDENHRLLASGSHEWENRYENRIWTYHLEDVWLGIQDSYRQLAAEVQAKYELPLAKIGAIGISAMMHGYLVFDRADNLLTAFRTWRNTMTGQAAEILTEKFDYPIPQRWSIAHLYQAILNEEEHVADIAFQTTLEGYVHWKLTGEKVIGIGEASGMFPIDIQRKTYDAKRLSQFEELIAAKAFRWNLNELLPKVLLAGDAAGNLSQSGAALLDPTGILQAGIPFCPPEGDAGTGMVATNSITPCTGNVSAGTSVFAMIVLEKELSKAYRQIDLVTTPAGDLVAMVHCNNCTSDLNAWVGLFEEFAALLNLPIDRSRLFSLLYETALTGDVDCGGLLAYNYLSGEHITELAEGRPLFVRQPDSRFTLANFMRVHLYTALGALKTGLDLLRNEEQVRLTELVGHGGFFKTPGVGQAILAAAINAPVSVLETSGEGGAWGCAVLASYRINKQNGETLDDYLSRCIFNGKHATTVQPDAAAAAGFNRFIERYSAGLAIERAAVDHLR